jgi:predicted DNA-binding transcriptional regulator AlpA
MTQPKRLALPPNLPPRLINREAAAAYVNLSPGSFDLMVEEGKMPKPKQLTGRRSAWDVRALDVCVDNLPQVGDTGPEDTSWDD